MMAEEAVGELVEYDSHHRVVALNVKRVSRITRTPEHGLR